MSDYGEYVQPDTRRGSNRIDLAHQRFNSLTAIRRVKSRGRATMWLCLCDCGREKPIATSDLRSGHIRSCGCLRHGARSLDDALVRVIGMRRHMARRRGIEWTVANSEAIALLKKPCFYCGVAPFHSTNSNVGVRGYRYSGLDRANNSQGYVSGNVRSCCRHCNKAKDVMSDAQFATWCQRMSSYKWWTLVESDGWTPTDVAGELERQGWRP